MPFWQDTALPGALSAGSNAQSAFSGHTSTQLGWEVSDFSRARFGASGRCFRAVGVVAPGGRGTIESRALRRAGAWGKLGIGPDGSRPRRGGSPLEPFLKE